MSIQLTVMSLDFDGKSGPFTRVFEKDEITLGRLPNNDLVLDRPEVSAYHAKLRLVERDGKPGLTLLVKDLGSSNGTMVENKNLRAQVEVEIEPNQRIIIGNYLIKPAPSAVSDISKSNFSLQVSKESELFENDTPGNDFDADSLFAFTEEDEDDGQTTITADTPLAESWPVGEKAADATVSISASRRDALLFKSEALASPYLQAETPPQKVPDPDDTLHSFMIEQPTAAEAGSGIAADSEEPAEESFAPAEEKEDRIVKAESWSVDPQAFADEPEVQEPIAPVVSNTEPAAGLGSTALVQVVDGDVLDIDFAALQLLTLQGQITHRGRALPGVEVTLGELGRCHTDALGRFKFNEITEGAAVRIQVQKPGFRFDSSLAPQVLNADTTFDIVATQLFSVGGRILHKGSPLAGIEVDAGTLGRRVTEADGSFEFADIAEGTPYSLSFAKENYSFSQESISGSVADRNASYELNATRLFSVRGRITHKGSALAGVVVDGGPILGKTLTDDNGYYVFINVPENTKYTLTASKDNFRFAVAGK